MKFDISAEMTYTFAAPAEVLLLVEAARGADQTILSEDLRVDPSAEISRLDDPLTGEHRLSFVASGRVTVRYAAQVDVVDRDTSLAGVPAHALHELPQEALRFLRPSRYCPSDRFERYVNREFSGTAGGDRVLAILEWLSSHLDYVAGVSDAATTSLDTFVDRAGVCRDFTHLAISLCRASQIPARAVSAYGWKLEPPDMHAVLEVYLGGAWRLADPTGKVDPKDLVRVACGLDAADITFMTIMGQAQVVEQAFSIDASPP